MTEASEAKPTLPELDETFSIKINGAEREIIMKFALLRELARTFPNETDPQQIFQNQSLFELTLEILLLERDERGKATNPEVDFNLDDYDMDQGDSIKLVKWSMEHLIRFFLTKLSNLMKLGETNAEQIDLLLSSLPGLRDSLSKKPPVGPMGFSDLVSANSTGGSPTETSAPT